MTFPWTPERTALVRSLVLQGLSYTVIGRHLGVSRNAIAGLISRLRRAGALPPAGPPLFIEIVPGCWTHNRPPPRRHYGVGPQEPRGCRYIHGDPPGIDWRYCQAPQAPGSPYCRTHLSRCLLPINPRQRVPTAIEGDYGPNQ